MRSLDPEVIAAAKAFLARLVEYEGTCDRSKLKSADRIEDKARQACRSRKYAYYEGGGYWRITDRGRHVVDGSAVW